MPDNKLLEHFKLRVAKSFNMFGLWDCEHCYFRNTDPRICMICDRLSRAFIWFEELEETFNKLKEKGVEYSDEVIDFIYDYLMSETADSSLGLIEAIINEARKVFGDVRIRLSIYMDWDMAVDDMLLISIACDSDSAEKLEEVRSKFRDEINKIDLPIHITCDFPTENEELNIDELEGIIASAVKEKGFDEMYLTIEKKLNAAYIYIPVKEYNAKVSRKFSGIRMALATLGMFIEVIPLFKGEFIGTNMKYYKL